MKTKKEQIEVLIPRLDGSGEAERIPVEVELVWDDELQQWLLTPEAHEKLEATKSRYVGLLLPQEIKALRRRLRLTQAQICALLQIGEKTWTRWETGRERPSRALNVLLCALRDGQLTVPYLRRLAELRQSRAEILAQKTRQRPSPWRDAVQQLWARCRVEPTHLWGLEDIPHRFAAAAEAHQLELPTMEARPEEISRLPAWRCRPAVSGFQAFAKEPTSDTAAAGPSSHLADPSQAGSALAKALAA